MIQGSPELERTIYDEGVGEAYRCNQLRDRLSFAAAGLVRYDTPGYFKDDDLQNKLRSNVLESISDIQAELRAAENNVGDLIGVDSTTGLAIGLVATSPYRADS